MNNVSGQQYIGGRKGITYQVLIERPGSQGDVWTTIDPKKPLDIQTKGMVGYRLLDSEGKTLKQRF